MLDVKRTAIPGNACLIPPSVELADCVRHGLITTLSGGDYRMPAGLHSSFLIVLTGKIMQKHGGQAQTQPRMNLYGSTRGVRHGWAEPGTRVFILPVRAGQLRRLVDCPGLPVADCCVAFSELLHSNERGEAARCEAAIEASNEPLQQADIFLRFLSALRRRRAAVASDLFVPPTLLQYPTQELATRFGLSQRQFERRFLASYGQSLRGFRQQLRYSRLMPALALRVPDVGPLADIAADFGFYDQSHLHRELLRFTSYTPAQLRAGVASNDPAFWPYCITPHFLPLLFGPTGY